MTKLGKQWGGHVACTGEVRNVENIFARKPTRNRPPGWPRHKWEDNMKMNLKETD
jgi:hypothetical protein